MNNLKNIRKRKKISQKELGKLLGVDQSIISKVENGELYEGKEFWKKISDILGVGLFDINPTLRPELPPIYTYICIGDNILEEIAFGAAKRLSNENSYTPKMALVFLEENKYANSILTFEADDMDLDMQIEKSKIESGCDVMIPVSPPKRPISDFILKIIACLDFNKYEFIIIFSNIKSVVNLMEEIRKISKRIVIGYNGRKGEIEKIKEIAYDERIFVSNLLDKYDELTEAIPDVQILNYSDSTILEKSGSNDLIKGPSELFRISSSIREKLECLAEDAGIPKTKYIDNLLSYIDPIDMKEHFKIKTPYKFIHEYKEKLKEINGYRHDCYQTIKLSSKSKLYFQEAKEMGISYADLLTLIIELQYDAFCDKGNRLLFSHNRFSG